MVDYSGIKSGLALLKVKNDLFVVCEIFLGFYCEYDLVMQGFLSISLSLIIQVGSSGEGRFMGSMMISNAFHILAVQHLNYFSKLAKSRT